MQFISTCILLFVLSINSLFAQKKPKPGVSKGYYSIGDHAEKKLPPSAPPAKMATDRQEIKKGYYSIGNNSQKLPKGVILYTNQTARKAKKGFYSIEGKQK